MLNAPSKRVLPCPRRNPPPTGRIPQSSRVCCVGERRGLHHPDGMMHRRCRPPKCDQSTFAGYRFPPEVILLAVRWCLRSGLSYATSRNSWRSGASRSTMSPTRTRTTGSSPTTPGSRPGCGQRGDWKRARLRPTRGFETGPVGNDWPVTPSCRTSAETTRPCGRKRRSKPGRRCVRRTHDRRLTQLPGTHRGQQRHHPPGPALKRNRPSPQSQTRPAPLKGRESPVGRTPSIPVKGIAKLDEPGPLQPGRGRFRRATRRQRT